MLIVLVLLVLIAGEVVVSRMLASRKKSQQNQKIVATKNVLPIDMAKKALDCLEMARDERGAFVVAMECDEKSQCSKSFPSNRYGLYVMWGRTKYVEKTNDQYELGILRKDIDLYLDQKKFEVIQPDFISKMFLYDMWQSKIFTNEDKGKIKALTERIEIPELTAMNSIERNAKSSSYKQPNLVSLIVNKKGDGYVSIDLEDEWIYSQVISAASDYIIDYQWFKNPLSLKIAEGLFYGSIEKYFSSNKVSIVNRNLLGITAIQFYQVTGEKVFLYFAVDIYNHPEIKSPCFLNQSCTTDLLSPIVSEILSDYLSITTGETNYREYGDKMINYLVQSNINSTEGCYYTLFPKGKKDKQIMENGLMIGLLSKGDKQ
jgi:hypothetical protein